jgi:hypothetical protein
VQLTVEERLLEESDLSLEQLSRWSGIPYSIVKGWADLEVDIDDEQTLRLRAVIALAAAYYDRCVLLAQVLDETYGSVGS